MACRLSNEAGNAVLVFSGEDHPEPGTAAKLKERGHSLSAEGPSYLVHLYEEDPSFPAGLNGWFHGLLVDRRRKTATLFNDRYGMHRLYYHESKDAFYFAAEAKAILAVRPELRRADIKGLGNSSPWAVCWKTGPYLKAFTCCRRLRPGRFETAPSSAKQATSSHKSGKSKNLWTRKRIIASCAKSSRETCPGISMERSASGCH